MAARSELLRRRVVAILNGRSRPASAYELLEELRIDFPKIAPMTIYRALSALVESGKVLRIESLNAFIACQSDAPGSASILSICDGCGVVEESVSNGLIADLSRHAGKTGFTPQRHVVEVHGHCVACCGDGAPE
ncbi:MAG: Fur family transcriptional regulator [Pseudomonadota bacterium]